MNSPIQSLDQLYAEMNQKHATQTSAEFISFQPQEQQMDPFTPSEPLVAPVAPAKPMEVSASASNPFRSMPAPIQPSLPTPSSPQVQHTENKQNDAGAVIGQMHMYFDRMTKMMMTMDDRLTRLESLMSHNLYVLHQQQQQQQPVAKGNKDTQEEDLESALKEQVKAELAQLKKMQAQYEKDSEVAKKIQAQMDDEYFSEERKKFYTQPQTVTPYQAPKPRIPGYEECPLCQMQFKQNELESHVYACLDGEKNIAADGTKKVVDKPGFLARLFGGGKPTSEEKTPLVSSQTQHQPHHSPVEYPGQPGGIYPGIAAYHAPMYPLPSSPYMGAAMPPPPMYYYVPPAHNPSQ